MCSSFLKFFESAVLVTSTLHICGALLFKPVQRYYPGYRRTLPYLRYKLTKPYLEYKQTQPYPENKVTQPYPGYKHTQPYPGYKLTQPYPEYKRSDSFPEYRMNKPSPGYKQTQPYLENKQTQRYPGYKLTQPYLGYKLAQPYPEFKQFGPVEELTDYESDYPEDVLYDPVSAVSKRSQIGMYVEKRTTIDQLLQKLIAIFGDQEIPYSGRSSHVRFGAGGRR